MAGRIAGIVSRLACWQAKLRSPKHQTKSEEKPMQLSKARELREQRAKICQQAQATLENNNLNAEERSRQFEAMMADADRIKTEIDRFERVEALEAETRGLGAPPNARPGEGNPDEIESRRKQYAAAFRSFLRSGLNDRVDSIPSMTAEERSIIREYRDMGTGGQGAYPGSTGTAGGFFVPVGFSGEIETALKYYGPMLSGGPGDPKIFETASGQPLPWPTVNDTGTVGELIGENQTVNAGDVTVGQIVFGAFKFSTKMVKASLELLQDSAFDIESYLKDQFAIRLGRILNTKFTTGVGTTEPYGIVTQATLGGTATGANSNDGVSAANTLGSDDFTTLEHSVDILYRRGAKYMMHDGTLAAVKKVKDKYGRPLWQPGLAVNQPDTINGYAYLINNDMDQLQTQATSPTVTRKVLLFGDLSKYLIRRVRDLSVLRLEERYAEFGQVAFIGFARYDGAMLDAGTNPVKYLKTVY
jgi:HK97 family phage major capsid protein